MDYKLDISDRMPEPLRVGLQTCVPNTLERIAYFGKGPQENYSDRCDGAFLGLYRSTPEKFMHSYITPSGKRQPLRRPLALADGFRRPGRSVRRGRTAERIGMELHAGESGQGAPQQRSRTFGRCSDRQYRPYADRCRRHGHLESQGPAFGSVPAAGETLRLPVHDHPLQRRSRNDTQRPQPVQEPISPCNFRRPDTSGRKSRNIHYARPKFGRA